MNPSAKLPKHCHLTANGSTANRHPPKGGCDGGWQLSPTAARGSSTQPGERATGVRVSGGGLAAMIRELLTLWRSLTGPHALTAWCVASEQIVATRAVSDGTRAVSDGAWLPRGPCPLCGATTTGPGYRLPAGLAIHLERTCPMYEHLREHVRGRLWRRAEQRKLVYLVRCRVTGRCKIGVAGNPHARLASLQTGSPTPLELVATHAGGHAYERELHRRYAEHALAGEWFDGPAERFHEFFPWSSADALGASETPDRARHLGDTPAVRVLGDGRSADRQSCGQPGPIADSRYYVNLVTACHGEVR